MTIVNILLRILSTIVCSVAMTTSASVCGPLYLHISSVVVYLALVDIAIILGCCLFCLISVGH